MFNYRIAIDGPSGSGKSTVAKLISQRYNLKYVNTGLVYRAIAYYCINKKVDFQNQKKVNKKLKKIKIKLLKNNFVDLNKKILSKELRSNKISKVSSIISSYEKVRKFACEIQKTECKQEKVIIDGRDTTFNIMPDADIKIFLDTSVEERTKRRIKQNEELGFSSDYQNIFKEIEERDFRDRNREKDPLHVTQDAIFIDASYMKLEQVVDYICAIIEKRS